MLSFTVARPDPEVDLGVVGLRVTHSPVPTGQVGYSKVGDVVPES